MKFLDKEFRFNAINDNRICHILVNAVANGGVIL